MITAFDEDAAVECFWKAGRNGEHFLADWYDRLSFDEAYRIQLGVVARRVALGEQQVGWKVAQTSEAARQSFGFTEPVFGCVMCEGLRHSGHEYGRDEAIRSRYEPEVCVRLCKALSGAVDMAAVRQAVDAVHPAFEILEVRGDIAAQKALAIADNAATKDIVLGDPVPLTNGMDLAAMRCRVLLNSKEVAQGQGAEVLEDPLNAVIWLAGKLAQFGLNLSEGDLIMTGSITRVFQLAPGDCLHAEFEGLGAVDVSVAV